MALALPRSEASHCERIARHDFTRRSLRRDVHGARYKEWVHTIVHEANRTWLFNFLLSMDVGGRWAHYVTTIVFDDAPRGSVTRMPAGQCSAPGGQTEWVFGQSRTGFDGNGYHLAVADTGLEISVELALRPRVAPSLALAAPFGERGTLSWVVVPSLVVTGSVTSDGRTTPVNGIGYRDRNWGNFEPGDDGAWDWAQVTSSDGSVSVVVSRLMDSARTITVQQELFVWVGESLAAIFRADEIELTEKGAPLPVALSLPPLAALGKGSSRSGIRSQIMISATSDRGRLGLTIRPIAVVRVLFPRESSGGYRSVLETRAEIRVDGHVEGEPIAFTSTGVFERVFR